MRWGELAWVTGRSYRGRSLGPPLRPLEPLQAVEPPVLTSRLAHRREIRLDEQVQNWTPVTSNPALPERLVLRIKPTTEGFAANNAFNYGDQLSYKLMVKLTYVVEFKELKIGLRWPVQRNPARVTITADAETSTN